LARTRFCRGRAASQRCATHLVYTGTLERHVCLTTDLAGLTYRYDQFGAVGSNPVISIGETPLKDWQSFKKAGLDYVAGAILVAILLPVFALLALAIRLDSRGPILFRQPRLGFNNKTFICYKFRTMYADMTDVMAERQATRGDPRITRVGKLMRKFSLDELPQLINVLNGTMSCWTSAASAKYQGRWSAVQRSGAAICVTSSGQAWHHGLGAGQWLARRDGH
jgi:polysaccharide biosynthesis protein PslA